MLRHLVAGVVLAVVVTLAGVAIAGTWEDGVAAYRRGDYVTAHALWQPLAESGDARAENNLGLLYEKGLGVAADHETAADWYRKAAAQGNAVAQKNLDDLIANGLVDANNQTHSALPMTEQPPENLVLSGDDRWVQVASRQSLSPR